MPTAANLNLCRRRKSHVGWHSENDPLFGERGETKLIVSVSFGTRALFKWKGKSCPNNDENSCWLDHGDILVMDGQCQDEFYHCTDPGSEQERINVTFRWIRDHAASCSFLRTGVPCLPTCADGFSAPVTEFVGNGGFLGFLVTPRSLLHMGTRTGVLALLVHTLMCTGLGLRRCAFRWTRPLGGGRWGHYLRDPQGAHWAAQKATSYPFGEGERRKC